jgi:apolipoprotein D and lipocalin family protein
LRITKRKLPQTVQNVNLTLYLGLWYEQASTPFFFGRNCVDSTAIYSLNTDGSIKVNNTCVRDGKNISAIGKAFPDPEDETNGKLKVEFSETIDIKANYWIVRLDSNYTYAVVSNPLESFVWILYREPVMPEALYNSLITSLQTEGYPVDKL